MNSYAKAVAGSTLRPYQHSWKPKGQGDHYLISFFSCEGYENGKYLPMSLCCDGQDIWEGKRFMFSSGHLYPSFHWTYTSLIRVLRHTEVPPRSYLYAFL